MSCKLLASLLLISILPVGSVSASCPAIQWLEQQPLTSAVNAFSVAVVDANEDGHDDFITYESMESSSGGNLVLRLGVGDGTFGSPAVILTGVGSDPAVFDINGDGHQDVVATGGTSLKILAGDGVSFGSPVSHSLDYYASVIHAANVDGDAAIELVVLSIPSDLLVIYENAGGTFIESKRVTTNDFPTAVTTADFDQDGRTDFAVAQRLPQTIDVYFRRADNDFDLISLAAGNWPSSVSAGDFNNDARPDLVAGHWDDGTLRFYRNLGARAFSSSVLAAAPPDGSMLNFGDVVLRDVTGDGNLDVMAAPVNGKYVVTLAGTGDGAFRSATWSPSGWGSEIGIGDFDSDPSIEMITSRFDGFAVLEASCETQVIAIPRTPTITLGNTAAVKVTIGGFAPALGTDHGTLTIRNGALDLASVSADSDGVTIVEVPGLEFGTHALTAHYSGNAFFSSAESEPFNVAVTNESSVTMLSLPSEPSVFGTPWPVEVSVTGGGCCFQNRAVVVEVDGVDIPHETAAGPLPLSLEPGLHTIRARYDLAPASASDPVTITTAKATPGFVRTGGSLTVRDGASHTITFSLSGVGAVNPTGTLRVYEGTTLLRTAAITDGTPTFEVTLQRGAHDVTAVYSGDARYQSASAAFTLETLPNTPFPMEARGLSQHVHVAYALPGESVSGLTLQRRTNGGAWGIVSGWDPSTGIDPSALTRGVVYDYRLLASSGGMATQSNVDSAMLLTDDPLVSGAIIKRVHFQQLRDAINIQREKAGLAAFEFDATFTSSLVVRLQHLVGLRSAIAEARSALGMAVPAHEPLAVGAIIRLRDIQELREAAR